MVRIQNVPFRVVGVADRKGQSPGGNDYDDVVYVPVSTFLAKIQGGLQSYIAGTIMVEVTADEQTGAVAARIGELLRDRHNIAAGADDDFTVKNLTETASRKEESTQALTLLLASIAAVSLLVGGIGIMNIMLVSVTERTREIGVRVAVGAKPRHILFQFLIESLALSVMGGIAGVGLGLIGGAAAGAALRLADAGAPRRDRAGGRLQRAGRHRASASTRRTRRRASTRSSPSGTNDGRARP